MNGQHFIAKQRAKYYLKALKHSRTDTTRFKDTAEDSAESFWKYEQTPYFI